MDIDLATSGLERIVGSDPPLDTIAHGLYFGEGPVWDRRNRRFLWTDIIGDTIWQWTPGVGKQIVIHPSSHANGMTFDREGRLVVAGWSARTIWRGLSGLISQIDLFTKATRSGLVKRFAIAIGDSKPVGSGSSSSRWSVAGIKPWRDASRHMIASSVAAAPIV